MRNITGNVVATHFEPSRGLIGRPTQTPDLFVLDGSTEFRWHSADQEESHWIPDSVTEVRETANNTVDFDDDSDNHEPS